MQTLLKNTTAPVHANAINRTPYDSWGMRPISMKEWLEVTSPLVDVNLLHPRTDTGTNLVFGTVSDSILGVRYATGCQMFRHGPEHVLRAGGVVSIQRLHKGFAALEFPDCNYVHRGDVISVTDFAQPFRGAHKDAIGEGLFIPRDLLGLTHTEPFGAIVQPIESARGQRLMAEVSRFFEDTASGRAYDRTQLIGMVRGMVARFWNPGSDREEWWLGRRKLIHKYIETHLDDPNLGPLQICGLFNMSRATLYRMFEQDGGVRRFIQDRRLLSAMWDLASGGLRRGRLSQVAERWGFSSDANFNRAVKQTFGMPPGSLFKKSVHVQTPTYRGVRSSGLENFPNQAEWLQGYRPETPDLQQYMS